jgi:hypothetical protein
MMGVMVKDRIVAAEKRLWLAKSAALMRRRTDWLTIESVIFRNHLSRKFRIVSLTSWLRVFRACDGSLRPHAQ